MIAHVAAAGEQRGRVVLQLTSGRPNRIALLAALRVAKAFESEIESLFVEDQNLYACAGFPFASEISLCGRGRRPLSEESIAAQLRHLESAIGRELETLARNAEVPLRQTVVRDEPFAALARACAERGPWNVIALGGTVDGTSGDALRRMFDTVHDTTGVIVAGPRARGQAGPLVVVLEDVTQLEPMLRTAKRLVPEESPVTLVLVADATDTSARMEGEVRLVLGSDDRVIIARAVVAEGGEAALYEVLRRLHGGFAIGQFGGRLVPSSGDIRHLVASLECPLLIMR